MQYYEAYITVIFQIDNVLDLCLPDFNWKPINLYISLENFPSTFKELRKQYVVQHG